LDGLVRVTPSSPLLKKIKRTCIHVHGGCSGRDHKKEKILTSVHADEAVSRVVFSLQVVGNPLAAAVHGNSRGFWTLISFLKILKGFEPMSSHSTAVLCWTLCITLSGENRSVTLRKTYFRHVFNFSVEGT
jgi:hypothetical protein